jgi:hypothetical protein
MLSNRFRDEMINCCSVENSIRTENAQLLARTFPGDLIATYNLAFPRDEPPRVFYCCWKVFEVTIKVDKALTKIM